MGKHRKGVEPHVILPGESRSGRTYVWLRLKEDAQPDDNWSRVTVRPASLCEHDVTVCEDCYESWSIDYDSDLQRTQAGRELQDKLNQKG